MLVLTVLNIWLLAVGVFRPFDYGVSYGGCVVGSIAGAMATKFITRNRWSHLTFSILGWLLFWLLVMAEHVSSNGHPDHRLDWVPWIHVAVCIVVFTTFPALATRAE